MNLNAGSFNYKKASATIEGGNDKVKALISASTEKSKSYKEFNVLKSKQFANLHIGGKEFGSLGPMSEQQKKQLSAQRKGIKLSKEHRAKISEGGKRRPPCSAETRAKLSAALKGKKKSAEHIAKMSANATNISEETRAKMSAKKKGQVPWNKGMPRSEETKAKISATKRAKK